MHADVAEVKDLKTYLSVAASGEEVAFYDHHRLVAKLIPCGNGSAVGDAKANDPRLTIEEILRMPRPKVTGGSVLQALLDERESGR